MIFLLVGGPVVWYVTQRRQRQSALRAGKVVYGSAARTVHQLRQVFSALLLGSELLERRAAAVGHESLVELSQRLHSVAREGIAELNKLGDPNPPDLLS